MVLNLAISKHRSKFQRIFLLFFLKSGMDEWKLRVLFENELKTRRRK